MTVTHVSRSAAVSAPSGVDQVALEVSDVTRLLEAEGISARVIDMHTVKPLDRDAIAKAASETGAIVVAEDPCPASVYALAKSAGPRPVGAEVTSGLPLSSVTTFA